MPLLHLATLLFAGLLGAVCVIDVRTMRIPDALNLLIGVTGLAAAAALQLDLAGRLIGVAAGYGSLFLVNAGYQRARGRDGLGMGDAKLAAACGAWLGWQGLPFQVLLAASFALMAVAGLRIAGRTLAAHDRLAFGPFLALGAFAVWLAQAYG